MGGIADRIIPAMAWGYREGKGPVEVMARIFTPADASTEPVTCETCGMTYVPADFFSAREHRVHHLSERRRRGLTAGVSAEDSFEEPDGCE